MKCDKCQLRDASVPFTTGEKIEQRMVQLCMPCASTYHWLTPMDLYSLGFATQPSIEKTTEFIKMRMKQGPVRSVQDIRKVLRKEPLIRAITYDVDFLTLYLPSENWKASDPPDWKIQPGYEDERIWWQREIEAGRMVLFGPAIEGPYPGSVMLGWLCSTLDEAEGLARMSPWVARKVVRIFRTTSGAAKLAML
jgi:hypothetical protein